MAKCPKCENDTFKIEKREDQIYCYVVCEKCNTVVGVLEDIDFKKHNNAISKDLKLSIQNECGLDRLINEKTEGLKTQLNKNYSELNNKIDDIQALLYKIIKR